MSSEEYVQDLPVEYIDVLPGRRPLDEGVVLGLMESIKKVGLMSPIAVLYLADVPSADETSGDSYRLLTGGHRLEAFRCLNEKTIPCRVFKREDMDERKARMWEISENLHRAELGQGERDKQIVEWTALAREDGLAREIPEQVRHGGHNSKGYTKTANDLGLDEKEVRDAHKLAELKPEIKEAANAAGLSRSDTLKVARAAPEEQQSKVADIAERKASPKAEQMAAAKIKQPPEEPLPTEVKDLQKEIKRLKKVHKNDLELVQSHNEYLSNGRYSDAENFRATKNMLRAANEEIARLKEGSPEDVLRPLDLPLPIWMLPDASDVADQSTGKWHGEQERAFYIAEILKCRLTKRELDYVRKDLLQTAILKAVGQRLDHPDYDQDMAEQVESDAASRRQEQLPPTEGHSGPVH